jgi:hypothetical protein
MNSIRQADGKWIDSSVFRQEAIRFAKHGYFCPHPWGTASWQNYWETQLERCREGYRVGNHAITGHHYMYLNFTQIEIAKIDDEDSIIAEKETKPPDFWDGDYDYYWAIEIAKSGLLTKSTQARLFLTKDEIKAVDNKELSDLQIKELKWDILKKRMILGVTPHPDYLDGGNHVIIGKSRRKGFSYKNGAICANVYNTERKKQIVIGAFEKKFLYPTGTMGMATDYLNFLNEHTGWKKSRDYSDKIDHKKCSYKSTVNGVGVELGYKSEIFALTFKDNPDAARGKDGRVVLLEEAGAFPNLKASYKAIYPALTAGRYITGQIFIFGTGGDMEVGTVDYADMFYDPITYKLMPFMNQWDENAENTYCGFFHPVEKNLEGFIDSQGNSDIEGARAYEMGRRKLILETSTGTGAYQGHIQEFPFSPSEAFLTVSVNDFPIVELRNQLNKVIREKLMLIKGSPVYLSKDNKTGKIIAKPDLANKLNPIIHYKVKEKDLTGCPVIYEFPSSGAPKGLYKIGYDPYTQDQSQGLSLASIYVYKGVERGSFTKDVIAASYVGRPQTTDTVNRMAEMLAELYNAEIMYENQVPDVKKYFERRKKLHLLAAQPDGVINKTIKNSKVARIYGCHMNDQLKDAGAKYIKQWLLKERDFDEFGTALINIDYIYDIGLLEELILYNKKGNFDRVMSLMQLMFQIEEEDLDKEYSAETENSNAKDLIELMNNYRKN